MKQWGLSRLLFSTPSLFILAVAAPILSGYTSTGEFTGRVTDATDSILPGAVITAMNLNTGVLRRVTTNEQGYYRVPLLKPGSYKVDVEREGFRTITRSGIILHVNQVLRMDFEMRLGAVAETIEVAADSRLLNTEQTSQGQVIDNRKIVDLPLNGRDYVQLALLSYGAVQPVGGRYGGFSASGQRTTQNNYMIDGIDNNSLQAAGEAEQADTVRFSVDAIQEFKVVTNSYAAEYGRAAGGVLNVSLKSGTNDIHGTAFGFLRNDVFDARNFFAPADKPAFKRSQFGGAVGGPIIKDKTFFFGDYEGTRVRETSVFNNNIPTLKMRAGDYSEIGAPIFDPDTLDPATDVRQPFANNQIPESRFDPIAQNLLSLYPQPQNPNLVDNFLFVTPANQNVDKWDVKIDHNFASSDTISYRLSRQVFDRSGRPRLPAPAFGGTASQFFEHSGWNSGLVWNHVFSPTVLTSNRLGYNFLGTARLPPIQENVNRSLGIKGVNQDLPGGMSQFASSGFTAVGIGGFANIFSDSQTRQFASDTTWVKGSHTIKFGGGYMAFQMNNVNPQFAVGHFNFNGQYTRDLATSVGGHSIADFLLGDASQGQVSKIIHIAGRGNLTQLYVQDDWKVTSKLTLNIGLRYEVVRPWVDKFDNIANMNYEAHLDGPPVMEVAKKGGSRVERSFTKTDSNNLAPRFGFAYEVSSQTVLRGGYGVFFANYEPMGDGRFLQANPPFAGIVRFSTDPAVPSIKVDEGFPEDALSPERLSNVRTVSIEKDPSLPYSQQWNFNIQRMLGSNVVWEVGYYGSKSNHLVQEINPNYALPGPGNVNTRRRYSGFLYPGTEIFVGPLAQIVGQHFLGNSTFNSFQTRIEKRFSGGFSLLGSYMFSKTMGDTCGFATRGNAGGCGLTSQDPLNRQLQRAVDNQNVPHRFVVNSIYELPFGAGKRWGTGWSGAVNHILGGWTVAGIVTLTSGRPLSVTVRGNPANNGEVTRANLVGNPTLDRGERTLGRWFNTDAFEAPPVYTLGNSARNLVTAPGVGNLDFAVYKQFSFTEDIHLQFRAEAFNLFNTPHFNPPGGTMGTGNYGRITSAGRQRNLQFGLKIIF